MPFSSTARITTLATLFTALGPITMSMYAPAMPALAAVFDTTVGMVQLTLALYLVAFAVAQLAYGPLSDRYGRRPVLLVGLVIYVAGSVAASFAPSIGGLLLARFVQAVGACAGVALARAIVRDCFAGAEAARVMAVIGMALTVAPAVGPVLGGYLQVWFGWQAIFLVQAACGIGIGLAAWTALGETNRTPDPTALDLVSMTRNYARLLASPVFMGYAALNASALGGLFAYAAVAPFVFITTVGLSPELYGWTTLLTTTAYFVGAVVARRGVGRQGIEAVVLRGGLCAAAGAALLFGVVALDLAAAAHKAVAVALLIGPMMLMTMGTGMIMPGSTAGALQPFPRMAGAASALMGFLQMGVGALGSYAAALFDHAPVWALGTVPGAMALLGLGAFLALVWRRAPAEAIDDEVTPAASLR